MSGPIRLIATDMDGTLVHSSGGISPGNRAAMEAARAAGIHIVVCTGRRHSYAMRVLREAGMAPHETVISSNGVVTRTIAGHLSRRATLADEHVRRLCRLLDGYRNALVLTFDRNHHDGSDAPGALAVEELDTLHRSIRRWMEVNAVSIRKYPQIEDALTGEAGTVEEPIQAMLCGGVQRMAEAEALLTEHFGEHVEMFRTEYPSADLCILDVVPKGESKGVALLRVAEQFGVPPEQVLAIGDNWNDVPMLEMAGHSVVLQNAPEPLRSFAREQGWTIGAEGDADGFAKAVWELTGLRETGAGERSDRVNTGAL